MHNKITQKYQTRSSAVAVRADRMIG